VLESLKNKIEARRLQKIIPEVIDELMV